ncbi:PAS domain-containing hybrid sensor histidine kinase/response regulator [Ferrimonas lipolytica]|uniref:histidine kinase n=1 Tax=Ferrimonas lipolytica TaxID=2724191 RepID=A0A6H1UCM3_9GAMM|nr:PAS domain-containing hybrid sensor histidine kinase/response regulator [Ferrimonas lipolytica]QIZ76389.1 response regulator [Ferrimonas lipolytica]
MNSSLGIVTISLLYISLLFLVAWAGERWTGKRMERALPAIYGLSLAVYCSSWSFLGTVGQAVESPWAFLPIYIGPILLFSLGFGFLRKVVGVANDQSITSVADFIAARYGKSQVLAVVVTLLALLGLMPYIALQLKAMVVSINLFQDQHPIDPSLLALGIAISLAIFAIFFGTRKLDATEHNPGMIMAVAFESIIKLAAFILVGLVVVYTAFDGPWDLFAQAKQQQKLPPLSLDLLDVAPDTIIAMAAFVALPRMFHVLVVENQRPQDINRSRWSLPIYLMLFSLFVIPLAIAGRVLIGDQASPDTYVIVLPQVLEMQWLAVVALLGAISAASSMVIVAVVSVAIMISNEWMIPLLLRSGRIRGKNFNQFSTRLLNTRRFIIVVVLFGAYGAYLQVGDAPSLARIGMLAFGAFAQLGPALVGAVYWRGGHRHGVLAGLSIGIIGWAMVLAKPIWPAVEMPFDWFGLTSDMSQLLLVMTINGLIYVAVSTMVRPSVTDRVQARIFTQTQVSDKNSERRSGAISQQDLLLLVSRFVGPERAYQHFAQQFPSSIARDTWNKHADPAMVETGERLIASVLGAASASAVLDSVLLGQDLAIDQVFSLVDDASAKILLSQDQMRGAIEHAAEGISVVDGDLNLVAWNRTYETLFDYPQDFLVAGMPVADIVRYNASLGRCGPGTVEDHVAKRVSFMKAGSAHKSERRRGDGRVIQIQGNPMPDGGFVMTFSDITDFRRQQQELTLANETLELRVAERTQELTQLNQRLLQAKAAEEQANQSKTRFLAAVGHDLMQPLNAARLFTASLLQETKHSEADRASLVNIAGSLRSAGEMLSDLLDISKLESGTLSIKRRPVALSSILEPLVVEFEAMVSGAGLRFRHRLLDVNVDTDPNMLRRVVQNFLTNALRYTDRGTILLGCRRRHGAVEIQVLDTGCGIDDADMSLIFAEFKQVDVHRGGNGLGLGLAIADRIAKVLNHPLAATSSLGRGSMFSVTVPITSEAVAAKTQTSVIANRTQPLAGIVVLCIDNEAAILSGLKSLLERWQCQVVTATCLEEAKLQLGFAGVAPDVMLADYHLDNNKTGLDAMLAIRASYGNDIPGILITADNRKELIEQVDSLNFGFMAKMVKPAALRAMMSSMLRARG